MEAISYYLQSVIFDSGGSNGNVKVTLKYTSKKQITNVDN